MSSARRWFLLPLIPGYVVLFSGLFLVMLVLALLLVKVLWAWTVPDLFPGAVAQGLIAPSISWLTSLKLAIFIAVVGAVAGVGRGHQRV